MGKKCEVALRTVRASSPPSSSFAFGKFQAVLTNGLTHYGKTSKSFQNQLSSFILNQSWASAHSIMTNAMFYIHKKTQNQFALRNLQNTLKLQHLIILQNTSILHQSQNQFTLQNLTFME